MVEKIEKYTFFTHFLLINVRKIDYLKKRCNFAPFLIVCIIIVTN